MREMNCTDIEQQLIEYAEGTLPEELIRAVDCHLRSCPACAELVSEAQLLFSSDDGPASVKAPDSLWRTIQNEINRIDRRRQGQPASRSTRRPVVTILLRSLGAAAALVLGIYLGSGTVQDGEATELTYEDEMVEYYASAIQGESAIPVGEVIYDFDYESQGSGESEQ
jgi:anti-sigma factor RsiW